MIEEPGPQSDAAYDLRVLKTLPEFLAHRTGGLVDQITGHDGCVALAVSPMLLQPQLERDAAGLVLGFDAQKRAATSRDRFPLPAVHHRPGRQNSDEARSVVRGDEKIAAAGAVVE